MNGLKHFEREIEQTTEIMPPSPKTITAAAMTTNRITNLRELLHYRIADMAAVSDARFFRFKDCFPYILVQQTHP